METLFMEAIVWLFINQTKYEEIFWDLSDKDLPWGMPFMQWL
jgi:hypothetical protein